MLTEEKREQLLKLSTPLAVDAMDRLGLQERVLDPAIGPVVPFTRMVGAAVTVLLRSQPDPAKAGLGLYGKALESGGEWCSPIIAVEVPAAHHHQGIFGEGAATTARRHGFTGALIDGAVRDTHDLREMGFPAFSRTISPGYICGKVEAVSMGDPIRVGGVTIKPGDIIVADNDGVMVIDAAHLDEVIDKAMAIKQWEHCVHKLIADGVPSKDALATAGAMP
jgi:4-hydroxy-4-methyl-2-oxoglutarate aldolase